MNTSKLSNVSFVRLLRLLSCQIFRVTILSIISDWLLKRCKVSTKIGDATGWLVGSLLSELLKKSHQP